MITGTHNLIDACLIQTYRFDNVSNNLANVNTNGFKKDVISFDQALKMNNIPHVDLTPGPVVYTGNKLDLALEKTGFFKVQTPMGIRYTRDGSFVVNAEGALTTKQGDSVLGKNGRIRIEGTDIEVNENGQVTSGDNPVDRISVVDFKNRQLLKKEGASYFMYRGSREDIVSPEDVQVRQGYLEKSNVSSVEEMIKMIETLRVFEAGQRAIKSMDEMNHKMVNEVGIVQ